MKKRVTIILLLCWFYFVSFCFDFVCQLLLRYCSPCPIFVDLLFFVVLITITLILLVAVRYYGSCCVFLFCFAVLLHRVVFYCFDVLRLAAFCFSPCFAILV